MLVDNPKLLFVYNADSSLFNQVGDLIHKTISPKTYQCKLCGLTYLGISMKREWKNFINSLPIKADFIHKNEFIKQYPKLANTKFPAVFKIENDRISIFASSYEINETQTLQDLENIIRRKL